MKLIDDIIYHFFNYLDYGPEYLDFLMLSIERNLIERMKIKKKKKYQIKNKIYKDSRNRIDYWALRTF